MPVSSSSSSSGISLSSCRSLASRARSVSRWVLTETYSPAAMLIAPAASPARPAVRMAPRSVVAAATPMTRPAVETMPSFAPSTPARSQLRRAPWFWVCGSSVWVASVGSLTGAHPKSRGSGGDPVGELDVELGQAALGVGRQRPARRAPPDVDVGVVVHLLGLQGRLVDQPDPGGEVRGLEGGRDAGALTAPVGEVVELALDLVISEQAGHGTHSRKPPARLSWKVWLPWGVARASQAQPHDRSRAVRLDVRRTAGVARQPLGDVETEPARACSALTPRHDGAVGEARAVIAHRQRGASGGVRRDDDPEPSALRRVREDVVQQGIERSDDIVAAGADEAGLRGHLSPGLPRLLLGEHLPEGHSLLDDGGQVADGHRGGVLADRAARA